MNSVDTHESRSSVPAVCVFVSGRARTSLPKVPYGGDGALVIGC